MDAGGDEIDEQQIASAAVGAARAAVVDDNDVVELPSTSDLSDVLDAITKADPGAGAALEADMARPVGAASMLPDVEIVEQPAAKAHRFRYPCEGRSAGSIPGINSTNENKTYPSIRINNYVGDVTIVVSCVNKDQLPTGGYRPHPHNLVGRYVTEKDKGVYTVKTKITAESREVLFKNIGIQCIPKKDVKKHLLDREVLQVDPFRTGFDPRSNNSLDLNQVRLAFQVFVPGSEPKELRPLKAVASDVIVDKKAIGELTIVRVGTVAGSARGGTQVIVLCEKVIKDETVVEFYEESSGWEVCVHPILVHKQYAIVFDTPPYRDPRTTAHANVKFRLRRINTGEKEKDVSNSSPFEYIPDETATVKKRKAVHPSLMRYETEMSSYPPANQQIKIEPNRMPQYQYSPPVPSLPEQQQHWNNPLESMQGLGVAGTTLNPFTQDMQFPNYQQSLSPMHPLGSPLGLGQIGNISPGMPQMGHVSPRLQQQFGQFLPQMPQMEPRSTMQKHMGQGSPMQQQGQGSPMHQTGLPTPGLQQRHGPQLGHTSSGLDPPMSQASPMGHISPGLQQQQQQQNYQNLQQMMPQSMDTSSTSLSALLREGPLPNFGLNSADLLSLEDGPVLDSLQRLSTNEFDHLS